MSTPPNNVPCWVELQARDLEVAEAFYKNLFGWESDSVGGYTIFTRNGRAAPGGRRAVEDRWVVYIKVADVTAVTDGTLLAGASPVVPPTELGELARCSAVADPSGAVVWLWEARALQGFEGSGEPGSYDWAELSSSDRTTAKQFYGKTRGWTFTDGDPYTLAELDGDPVAGVTLHRDVPDRWLLQFASADVDADASSAVELDGRVILPPTEMPNGGRRVVLGDACGADFALMQH